ncbi:MULTISPECIES: response regulator transcription factor [Priestia]|jgi:two-component system, OmpR family, response regulator|uniref:Heme response regulator HssR n=4 Tax=Priestia TaxID=2800373 RepID=D5DQZ7_PRIM1|nr:MULTISPECIES: response regulator transcription factor [Priestia]AVX08164.1 DNA-binding response regulator [Bacillus sp. Y-01]KOP74332.1 heme response regulator HssR [Bacillus sp. FJAT-21351]KQU20013.1 two-component system response regulator [Bacillus sp. Leaf75]KRD91538.1 two-component system response regulator [Bacillus sp. Root147]KRF55612.1 two-component system response regulator [Bacillus sp. Soil531]MBK0292014.1 response regulator transcription factor [Bacillus sp. S34]MBZ5480889.1 r
MIQILVADDDQHIRELISLYLENQGFKIIKAADGEEAWAKMEEFRIDLAVVDIMMPFKDGWELTKEIKEYFDIPVLMVTARGESHDKLKGFDIGTDDYVVKPFDPQEMVARVKALLRRYRVEANNVIYMGNIKLDRTKLEMSAGETSEQLPLKEFELLFTLVSSPGKIFTRDQLIQLIWGYDYEGDERTVDVHIKRLRERLNHMKNVGMEIKTIRGLGYRAEGC